MLSLAVAYLFYHQPPQIAYVDSAKMLNSYQAMIDGRAAYQVKYRAWQINIDTLSSGIQQAIKDYERNAAVISTQEKLRAQALLAAKQKQFAEYQRAVNQNAQREEAQSNEKIIAAVNAFLARYGKEHNYDLILLASQAGTIAYARPALDLTDEVVAELNKEYIKDNSRQ